MNIKPRLFNAYLPAPGVFFRVSWSRKASGLFTKYHCELTILEFSWIVTLAIPERKL